MARARYVPNQAGLQALATGPEIAAATLAVAEIGKAYGESISPRSTEEQRAYFDRRYGDADDGERYADSFEVRNELVVVRGRARVAARLENTAKHAAAVEFGNAAVARPHRVLGRVADHLSEGT